MIPLHCVVDARAVVPAALDGVGRHWWLTLAALPALLEADARDVRVTLVAQPDAVDALRAQTGGCVAVVASDVPVASLVQHFTWPRAIAALRPDVVTYPQYDMPFVPAGAASVAAVYDFTYVDEPGYFGARREHRRLAAAALLSSTVARATRVLTLSETIAHEIGRRFPRRADRVRVVAPGPVSLPAPAPGPLAPARFAYIGNHRPHKRVPVLLDAFARLRALRPDAELVLSSRADPRFADVAARARATPGVTLLEAPSDERVAEVVASSRALLFASVGEGFGFPVVEAQALGTPAIVADAGSLPEVTADGGIVISPHDDVGAWCAAMVRLLDDDERARLSARARAAAAARSWELAARSLVTIWREAAAERKNGRT